MIKRNLMLIGLTTLLAACGFHLRGTGDMQFKLDELGLSGRNAYGETLQLTRAGLENNGVRVTDAAPYHLILVREQQSTRTLSYTTTAQGAESELTDTLDYEIRGKNKLLLLSNQLEVQRSYVTDENNIAGSSETRDQIAKEMRTAMVRQLLSSIQMITPQQLETLQREAEVKVKAQAEAAEATRQADAEEATAAQEKMAPIELRTNIPGLSPDQ